MKPATPSQRYAEVLLPLKFKERITYAIPEEWQEAVVPGSLVRVALVGKLYTAVVREVTETPQYNVLNKIKPIHELTPFPPLTEENLAMIDRIASYYLCSPGEVFSAAAPSIVKPLKTKAHAKTHTKANNKHPDDMDNEASAEGILSLGPLPELSNAQQEALAQIRHAHEQEATALLNGVTGSGKTAIYIHLAAAALQQGKNVLYMVPEIALSRQLEHRLRTVFQDQLLVYHSKQTPARRRTVYETLAHNRTPHVILGLRSAVFLPFKELGLIIVDEEHDASYKQKEPAPRYNGRDAALFLAQIQHCPTVLGSATPSFESLYNIRTGRYQEIRLTERFFGGHDCSIQVINMRKERRKRAVKGSFSLTLLKAIEERLQRGEQCLIFRSRRAYATWVECPECGWVARCPHCNVSLSYHKSMQQLSCHYCGYLAPATRHCPACHQGILQIAGSGTERLEEELKALFPTARIARFDAETTQSKQDEERMLRQFEQREIDILVGTQMIAKGFDFAALTLTAVIQADALTTLFDFRADERALQLLNQLRGRAGRRDLPGTMIIQTTQADHAVFQWAKNPERLHEEQLALLTERQTFGFPPYVRMVVLTLKGSQLDQLQQQAKQLASALQQISLLGFSGPTAPPIDRIQGEYLLQFHLKIPRNRHQESIKRQVWELLQRFPTIPWTLDVDPL